MILRYIKRHILFTLPAAFMLLCSCVEDEFPGVSALHDPDALRISAYVAPTENTTRAYYGSNEVETVNAGEFILCYPMPSTVSSNTYAYYDLANVSFGHPEDPITGFVSFTKNGTPKTLKWTNIYGEGRSSVYFYLTNLNPDWFTAKANSTYSNQLFTFNSSSPFNSPAPLDKNEGTNDLLCSGGSSLTSYGYIQASAATSGTNLNFNLYHRMAMLKIDVLVYPNEVDGYVVNLKNATVTIDNTYKKLATFVPYWPYDFSTTSSPSSTSYCTVNTLGSTVLVGEVPENEFMSWEEPVDGHPIRQWGDISQGSYESEDGDVYEQMKYSISDFVFPPHTLYNIHPRLIIRVPKEDVTNSDADVGKFYEYSGYLPEIMYSCDEDGKITNETPIATALTSGYVLHITATINSPDTELFFAPVKIEAWNSKGSFTITTHQSGIYNPNDFYDLVSAYQQGNTSFMDRYGYMTGSTYLFQFWSNMTLDRDEISNQMNGSIPFSFVFNGYTITINNGDGTSEELSGPEGQRRLYEIVSGNQVAEFTGIRSKEDLETVLSLCSQSTDNPSPNFAALSKYGIIDNLNDSWIFIVDGSFEVDLSEIFMKANQDFLGYTVNFQYTKNSVVTVNMINGQKEVCSAEESFDILGKLVTNPVSPGIYEANDFLFLKKCYNLYYENYPDILKLYGTLSNSTWTFYFRNSMTLQGEDAFISMVPNGSTNPNYNISTSYTIVIADEKVPISTSTGTYLYYAFSGTGKATGTNTLSTIISYYNNNSYNNSNYYYLWNYGRFEDGKWIFPLTYNATGQYIAYSTLFGNMIPDETLGKFDYEFDFGSITYFQVRTMPVSEGSTSTTTYYLYRTENGAEILKEIALGTYWDNLNP